MSPETFVDELAKLAPTAGSLEAIGLAPHEIIHFRDSFIAEPRLADGGDDRNAVLRLLQHWNMSRVEIGMVRFVAFAQEMGGNVCIGYLEADPLLLSGSRGEIVVEDLEAPGHVLWRVAENGGLLLDALIPAAAFLARRAVGDISFDDSTAARDAVAQCASLAGGERYRQFYSMLLGAE